MSQNQYLSLKKIELLKPHIDTFVRNQYNNAIVDHEESDEFLKYMEDYLSTDSYTELLDSFKGKDTTKEVVNLLEMLVDVMYDDTDDDEHSFDWFIKDTLSSNLICKTYNLWAIDKFIYVEGKSFKKNTYLNDIAYVVDQAIDHKIEQEQKSYATKQLKIRWCFDWNIMTKLDAVLATAQCGSLDEVEQLIVNSFDFEALTLYNK